ncbi:MAG: carbamoyltransferase family protein [Planctomycetota bacterium]|jgi:carbamoyltransferase
MYILGVGGLGYKDSAAVLLSDGRLVAAAAEERFSGTKHEGGFPHRAMRFCLWRAGISRKDLAAVAVANNSWLPMRDKVLQWYGEGFFRSRTATVYNVFKDDTHRLVEYLKTLEDLRAHGLEIQEVPNDSSHKAAAFFPSPFESAAILTIGGRGEVSTSGIGRGRGVAIEADAVSRMPDSLGLLSALIADYLGYSDLDDEFRLISISPTGTPTFVPKMQEVVQVAGDGSYKLNPDYFGYHQGRAYLSETFTEVFGPPHEPDLPLEERHRDLAASFHAVMVDVVLQMATRAREKSGESRLCLGGGLVQNWALVGALCDAKIFDEVYVPPAPGDDGTALGAALFLYHAQLGHPRGGPLQRADFGPAFSDEEVAEELQLLKLKASKPGDLAQAAAERVCSGEIVGWFQGAAEFGPRALGHRSILADPTDPAARPHLVASVKARSEFHPFALSVTREASDELCEDPQDSPFMERTAKLKPDALTRLPAVAAQKGISRIHTVTRECDPLFHELLVRVGERSGVPAVLNTSLNEPGRAVATRPREAIGSLYTTGLDALAIGPFILAK